MGKFRRIYLILSSIVIIIASLILMLLPEIGPIAATVILCFYLIIYGIRQIVYFITMGCHMVGGKLILYKGIIAIDLGAFTLTLSSLPQQYVMIYLLIYYVIFAALKIFQALEAKKLQAGSWRLSLAGGLLCLGIAALCVINLKSAQAMVIILGCGYIYSAVMRIITACRKTAIVYIQ